MNRKLVFALSLFVLLCSSLYVRFNSLQAKCSNGYAVAPDFILTDIDGNSFSLNDYRGRAVLLDFFHTNCTPSVNQFSELVILHEDFGEKLVIISISTENETILRDFGEAYSINWTIAKDTSNVFDMYTVSYLPTLVIIDLQGYIRYTHVGLTEESVLRPEIESLLPNTIYVDDDNVGGPWNGTEEHPYQNITSGLEHASDNDIVFVQNGIYYEHVVVNKTVALIGEDKYNTIIDGNGIGNVVEVTASNVNITCFTIQQGGYGILLKENSFCNIHGNIIRNNTYGIAVLDSDDNTIAGNNVANNRDGIALGFESSYNLIVGNNVSDSYGGISLTHSSFNELRNNNMSGNAYNFGVIGYILEHFLQEIDTSNTVDGKLIYYLSDQNNLMINSSRFPNMGYLGLVNSKNITVMDLELKKNAQGVLFACTENSTVINVNASDNMFGIYLVKSNNNTIANNFLSNNQQGIALGISHHNTIIGNLASNNSDGILLQYSGNNMVTGNTVKNNADGIVLAYSDKNSVVDNTALNNSRGIVVTAKSRGNTIIDNTMANNQHGIQLWGCINNTVNGNTILNNEIGVNLFRCYDTGYASANNTVTDNTILNNDYGVYLEETSVGNIISSNMVSNNSYGVYLYDGCKNNTVSNNTITLNNGYAIQVYACMHNTIIGNTITNNNGDGIYLHYSYDGGNIIINNLIMSNNGSGIIADYFAGGNIIIGNIVSNNTNGLSFGLSGSNTIIENTVSNNDLGIYISYSDDSTIYHNNFINNTGQVFSSDSINTWDDGYPSGGNYWSDYIATANDTYSGPFQDETGSDGIGDTAYTIDANNTDNYPLMGMFSDFNATSEHHVQTICNSSISDFQYNGSVILFNVSGKNGTTGFCRICIPNALMNETYHVFVNGTEILPPPLPLPCSNSTHSYLYFTYNHSTQEVVIIPEFPSFLILPLFMIATLLTVIVYKKRAKSDRYAC